MSKPINLKTWLIPKLRRLSYQWPGRKLARNASRVSRGKYKCAVCGELYGPTEISMDHIDPVIPVETGFTDWNTYIDRLFCGVEGYQTLCDRDHDAKTAAENEQRAITKKDLTVGTNRAKIRKSKRRTK